MNLHKGQQYLPLINTCYFSKLKSTYFMSQNSNNALCLKMLSINIQQLCSKKKKMYREGNKLYN